LRKPRAPAHLAPATRTWFTSVCRDYVLEQHHLRLLQAAGECWDRLQEARQTLARDGLTIATGDGGLKAHPCVAIERDARIGFARLIRELDLDVEAPVSTRSGPPGLRSNKG
jgi:phage terminase small subunit